MSLGQQALDLYPQIRKKQKVFYLRKGIIMARKRQNDFHVYLNDYELEQLNNLCDKTRLDRSKIIRFLLLKVKLIEAPPVDYKRFIIELRRVGTNLNQLTAKANTVGFIDRNECKSVLDEVRKLEREIAKQFRIGRRES